MIFQMMKHNIFEINMKLVWNSLEKRKTMKNYLKKKNDFEKLKYPIPNKRKSFAKIIELRSETKTKKMPLTVCLLVVLDSMLDPIRL